MTKKLYFLFALFFCALCFSCDSDGSDKAKDPKKQDEQSEELIKFNLSDLEGKWVSTDEENIFEESWKKQDGDMEGIGYSIVDGDTIDIEYLCIADRNGVLSYGALVSSQQPKTIYFECVQNNESTLVFENENHDFPQRITYHKSDSKSMDVKIETLDGSYGVPFHFVKSE